MPDQVLQRLTKRNLRDIDVRASLYAAGRPFSKVLLPTSHPWDSFSNPEVIRQPIRDHRTFASLPVWCPPLDRQTVALDTYTCVIRGYYENKMFCQHRGECFPIPDNRDSKQSKTRAITYGLRKLLYHDQRAMSLRKFLSSTWMIFTTFGLNQNDRACKKTEVVLGVRSLQLDNLLRWQFSCNNKNKHGGHRQQ